MRWRIPVVAALALFVASSCDQQPVQPQVQSQVDLLAAKKPAASMNLTIDYVLVAHHGIVDAEGRLLVWQAELGGDIEGDMLWWFVLGAGPPNMPEEAHVSFYEARWEIWDDGTLLMAGKSGGTTARPPGKDGIWRGKGKVTEAYAGYEAWNGRSLYEGGNVDWTFPYSGQGIVRIN